MNTLYAVCLSVALACVALMGLGRADATCKPVNGHVISQVTTVLPDGTSCPSPLGLCTVGRLIGGLRGDFYYVAQQLVDNPVSTEVELVLGTIVLTTTQGTLTIQDATLASFAPDGSGAALMTIVQGTDALAGASGRLRSFGIFQQGCVDCDYRGEVCVP